VPYQVKIAICDDDFYELKKTKNTIDEFIVLNQNDHKITLKTFANGNDLLCYINKYGEFDLLLLDIIMPGMNGIELATEIRIKNSNSIIIFLTSSPEFAVSSYKINAFYYLLKPFLDSELTLLLNKALATLGEEKSNNIVVKEKGKLTRVQIHTIQYIESIKHTMMFHLRNNEMISCYGTMNEFHDILLSDERFVKCHKSFIVNLNSVISISNKDFILSDKTLIPISKQTFPQVKNAYIDFFFKKGSDFLT